MRRRILSRDNIDRICALREQGKSIGQIKRILHREGVTISEGAISWHCLIEGADTPNRKPLKSVPDTEVCVQRGHHSVRLFTQREDAILLELASTGMRRAEIARRLDRKRNSIVGRLATLARRAERAEP